MTPILRRFVSTMASSSSRPKNLTRDWFPSASHPLIIGAPMGGAANPDLASEVTKAGGLGFLQGGMDFDTGSPALAALDEQLTTLRKLLPSPPPPSQGQQQQLLPLAIGFLAFKPSARSHFATTAVPILARHRPAAIWLFAPDPSSPSTLREMIAAIKEAAAASITSSSSSSSPWDPRIVVQVGTVAAGRDAVRDGADVLVAQGVDAGGHQWQFGSGVVSLVPEMADMLKDEFPDRPVALWAAGGIADGRGVAAAMALGAEGAVMGTRYLVTEECRIEDFKKQSILETSDGGANTVKSQLHDHIQDNFFWPHIYDGRAVVHPSYRDHEAGVKLEDNAAQYREAAKKGDLSRKFSWSGTGVGLIREALPAATVTKQVREEALKIISGMKERLG